MQLYNKDLSDPGKTVIIGSRLWQDIMFGKLNNMASILVTDYNITSTERFFNFKTSFNRNRCFPVHEIELNLM